VVSFSFDVFSLTLDLFLQLFVFGNHRLLFIFCCLQLGLKLSLATLFLSVSLVQLSVFVAKSIELDEGGLMAEHLLMWHCIS